MPTSHTLSSYLREWAEDHLLKEVAPEVVPFLSCINAISSFCRTMPVSMCTCPKTSLWRTLLACCYKSWNLNVQNIGLFLSYTTSHSVRRLFRAALHPWGWCEDSGSFNLWDDHLNARLQGPHGWEREGKGEHAELGKEDLKNSIQIFFPGK